MYLNFDTSVPVEGKTLQALFDKLRKNHLDMKDEVKELCRRFTSHTELQTFKSLLLQFPPLHTLNEIVDDMSSTPKSKMMRRTTSPSNGGTPKPATCPKRKSTSKNYGGPSKALKFSPHLFKVEQTAPDSLKSSPKGCLELAAAEDIGKGESEDEIIEIDGL